MQTCIPQNIAEQLKQNISEIAIKNLAGMSEQERNKNIKLIVDTFNTDDATKELLTQGLNQNILEAQKEKLKKMIRSKKVSPKIQKTISDKIDEINNLRGFNENFIEEVIEAKLGARLSPEDAEKIAEAFNDLKATLDVDDNPVIQNRRYTPEFGEAMKKYREALNKANPSTIGDKIVSVFNTNLLFNVKSSLTNVVSNTNFGLIAGIDRTVEFGAPYKFQEAFSEAIEDAKFYAEYGFDLTRAQDLDENMRVLGEAMVNFSDSTEVEKLMGDVNKLVHQYSLSTPDQFYAGLAKRDTIYRLARNKVKEMQPDLEVGSKEFDDIWSVIVEDSLKINPQTETGLDIKNLSIQEANRVTFQQGMGDRNLAISDESKKTGGSTLSETSIILRRTINEKSKELMMKAGLSEEYADAFKLGTYAVPFVMTATNAISTGADYAGLKLPFRLYGASKKALNNAKNHKEAAGVLVEFIRDTKLQRPAIGIATGIALASLIPPENYIGEYPNGRERELIELGQANTNSIKVSIGGKDVWFSLDYLGPVAAPLVGVLEAKKANVTTGNLVLGLLQRSLSYAKGGARQLTKIPVYEGFNDTVQLIERLFNKPEDAGQTMANSILNFISSRMVPAIATDVGQAFDPVARDTQAGTFTVGGVNIDKSIANIPYFRNMLQEKVNVLGETVSGQGINEVLFGSRVKVSEPNPLTDMFTDLTKQGFQVTPTDYIENKFREGKVPKESLQEVRTKYGTGLQEAYNKLIITQEFTSATPEKQAELLLKTEDKYKRAFGKTLE